jgi:hypothetical protein
MRGSYVVIREIAHEIATLPWLRGGPILDGEQLLQGLRKSGPPGCVSCGRRDAEPELCGDCAVTYTVDPAKRLAARARERQEESARRTAALREQREYEERMASLERDIEGRRRRQRENTDR